MGDEPKPEADDPTAESAAGGPPTVPPSAGVSVTPATEPTSPNIRVEGLAETLLRVRHELDLISHASKFDWVNKRLILLRNAIIAFSVLTAVIILTVLTLREAYRETLSIAAFSVPEKLGERGITGQVVAQSLFDELIKRRTTVTTLDAGELKSAWSEHRSDVAVPETKFTLQAIFRYLRSLTGKEIAIDGEMLVDGDDVTLRARVQGKPARVVKGKLASWESLTGELADYVFEVTQPVVLASYLGLTARNPADIENLARVIRAMERLDSRTTPEALSVAYYAYGTALRRLGRDREALLAWDRARALNPKFGLPYIASASALYESNAAASDEFFRQGALLEIGQETRALTNLSRFRLAANSGDCPKMQAALSELDRLGAGAKLEVQVSRARMQVSCDYQQRKGIAALADLANLDVNSPFDLNYLGMAELSRELRPDFRQTARVALAAAAELPNSNFYAHFNFAPVLSDLGEVDAAQAMFDRGVKNLNNTSRIPRFTRAVLLANRGEYGQAEALFRQLLDVETNARAGDYLRYSRYVLERTNRLDEALVILRAGYTHFPAFCRAYDDAGAILFKRGRDAEAFAEWEKGIAAVPKCDLTYVNMARALIERKRIPEAKQKLEALLKVSPESDGAEIAKELLAGMAKAG